MTPRRVTILEGDALDVLRTLPDGAFQCCVTSPPYYGLRDYGHAGQIGLEPTPDEYVARMVAVFREVRRTLRDDGTLWLNIGDSYAGPNNGYSGDHRPSNAASLSRGSEGQRGCGQVRKMGPGLKTKDLIGIPWLLAFALRADGWYLRSEIIWHKPNPMPESVRDRPTKAHEQVFLLTKAPRYFYDADAIAEAETTKPQNWTNRQFGANGAGRRDSDKGRVSADEVGHGTRNARTVWTIATQPYSGAHFATMPPDLAERCIKAGTKAGDVVLDPFGGAGTTGLVADRLGRSATLIELNPEYARLARERITADAPLLGSVA
jgi:DNA modification methylase